MTMPVGVAPLLDDPVQKEGPVLATARHFRFGTFEFHTSPARLIEQGETIKVRPQALQVLELLLSRAGQTVSREEIRQHLWGNEEYLDHERGINSALLHLRKALRDEPQDPQFIETVPRQGYRFIAPVELSETPLVSRAQPAAEPSPSDEKTPRGRLIVLLVAVAIVLSFSLLWGRFSPSTSTPLPRIMIYPMQDGSNGAEVRPSAVSLTDTLVRILVTDYAGRLDIAAPVDESDREAPPQSTRRAGYQVTSSLTFDEHSDYAITLKLVRADDRTILWADTRHLAADELAQWPTLAAADLVHALENLPADAS